MPDLSAVHDGPPRPPGHLAKEGADLWRSVVTDYDLADHELKLLRLACEALDRCTQARRAIRRHGVVFEDRFGRPTPRPEVKIEQDSRAAVARLLAQLALPEEDDEAVPYGRPTRGRGGRFAPAGTGS